MKKLFVGVLVACLPFLAEAQETKDTVAADKAKAIQEITFGVMVDFIGTHQFRSTEVSAFQVTAAPCLNILTKHTHDHILYCLTDNTLQTLNGYLLPKYWDVYNFLSKSVVNRDAYGSIGIEKVLPATANLEFVYFAELGTDFRGTYFVSCGLVIHPYLSLRKH